MERYRHSQPGWVILVSMVAVILLIMLGPSGGNRPMPPMVMNAILGVLVICLALFYKLTVVVDDKYLTLKFGFGIIRKKFLLEDIVSTVAAKTTWYNGWGIHGFGKQWLYNVSGFDVVKVTMKDGRVAWIGTDDKEELLKALNGIKEH